MEDLFFSDISMPMLVNIFQQVSEWTLSTVVKLKLDLKLKKVKTEVRFTIDSYITYDLLLTVTKTYSFRK